MRNSTFYYYMQLINHVLYHWNERQRTIHPGKEYSQQTLYVIRPSGTTEGLLSLYFSAVKTAQKCVDKGYIPYIDFGNKATQYTVNYSVNGTTNAWEYYFCQPDCLQGKSVSSFKNVVLQGWRFGPPQKEEPTDYSSEKWRAFCKGQYGVQPYILDRVEQKYKVLFGGKTKILGLFLRGTDYVALRPKGHAIQPTIQQAIEKVDEFIKKYDTEKIFLVTEDYTVFEKMKAKYGDMICCSDDSYVKNYDGKDYVSNSFTDDGYVRGLNYLIRILLLARCDYCVGGVASGSLFALTMQQRPYLDSFFFELGYY